MELLQRMGTTKNKRMWALDYLIFIYFHNAKNQHLHLHLCLHSSPAFGFPEFQHIDHHNVGYQYLGISEYLGLRNKSNLPQESRENVFFELLKLRTGETIHEMKVRFVGGTQEHDEPFHIQFLYHSNAEKTLTHANRSWKPGPQPHLVLLARVACSN